MGIERIETSEDARLDAFREVADPRRVRDGGAFVAEGRRVVEDLARGAPHLLREVLLTEAALAAFTEAGLSFPPGVAIRVVASPSVLRTLTGVRFHQGCLAVADLPPASTTKDVLESATEGLIVVLESVTDPDNVGTIFRSARAFGAQGVVLARGSAHPLYRKALRTSLGNTLHLPFVFDPPWPSALAEVGEARFVRVALTPARSADSLERVARRVGRQKVALLFGSEAEGLSDDAFERADVEARIPLRNEVDSLNVAAAAAIALAAFARTYDPSP